MAEPYGTNEIRIRGLVRGSAGYITIGGNAGTLVKLGLIAGTYTGSDELIEEEVDLPQQTSNSVNTDAEIRALIPEVMEFGEVYPAVHSVNEQFDSRVAGSSELHYNYSEFAPHRDIVEKGTRGAGRPVITNGLGLIDRSFLTLILSEFYNLIGQFVSGTKDPDYTLVEALVAHTIQTPGSEGNPLPASSSFHFEIDPDGIYSTPSFFIRFSGSSEPFEVRKDAAYPSENTWKVRIGENGEPGVLYDQYDALKFRDINTIVSGDNTGGYHYLPLTGPDAHYVRLLEQEVQNTGDESIIKSINSKWTVTVGDGTKTFGDFNGDTAIQDAIDYFVANVTGVGDLTIQVKTGIYEAAVDMSSLPGSFVLTIQGSSGQATAISFNTIAIKVGVSADTFAFQKLILKDIAVNSNTSVATVIQVNNGCTLECYRCKFDTSVVFRNADAAVFENCILNYSNVAPQPRISFLYKGGASTYEDFIFRHCELSADHENPLIFVQAQNTSTVSSIRRIVLQDCKITLGGTTVTSNALDHNSGIIDLDPNGADAALNQGIRISNFDLIDCDVSFRSVSSFNSHLVMFCVPDGITGSGSLAIDNMNIVRNEWHLPEADTYINPITIYGIGDYFLQNGPKGLSIGLKTICPNSAVRTVGGLGVLQHETWFGDDIQGSGKGGLVSLGCGRTTVKSYMKIKDLEMINLTNSLGIGDVFIKWQNNLIIDGIVLNYLYAGSGSSATNKVRFRSPIGGTARINKIIVNGNNVASGTSAIIGFEPWAPSSSEDDHSIILSNCEISNTISSSTGIRLLVSTSYTGAPLHAVGFRMTNCSIRNIGGGGFSCSTNDGNIQLQSISIDNNTIINCGSTGIDFGGIDYESILISNNIIRDCTSYGIIFTDLSVSTVSGSPSIIGNHCSYNNGSVTAVQIRFVLGDGVSVIPKGIIQGNNCGGLSTSIGDIQVNQRSGSSNTALAGTALIGAYTTGIETGIDTLPKTLEYLNNNYMLQNRANLVTP